MSIEERARLESEAEYLVQVVHMRLHEDGVVPYQQGYDARQQLRKLTLVSAMAARTWSFTRESTQKPTRLLLKLVMATAMELCQTKNLLSCSAQYSEQYG